jgi:hypothetical protein
VWPRIIEQSTISSAVIGAKLALSFDSSAQSSTKNSKKNKKKGVDTSEVGAGGSGGEDVAMATTPAARMRLALFNKVGQILRDS